ncbi:GSDA3 protein, partial [Origma solitaria]|nr:GSDA3 protein [Origma solitaria]
RILIQTQFISAELTEDQLLLLLESLERKIVSQQLKLVRIRITLGSFQGGWGLLLLSFPQKEQRGLTMALVVLSGVQLREDGSALPGYQPFEAVAALFVALYALNLLSG